MWASREIPWFCCQRRWLFLTFEVKMNEHCIGLQFFAQFCGPHVSNVVSSRMEKESGFLLETQQCVLTFRIDFNKCRVHFQSLAQCCCTSTPHLVLCSLTGTHLLCHSTFTLPLKLFDWHPRANVTSAVFVFSNPLNTTTPKSPSMFSVAWEVNENNPFVFLLIIGGDCSDWVL